MTARITVFAVLATMFGVVVGCSTPELPPPDAPAPEAPALEVPVQAVAPPQLTPEAARQALIDRARTKDWFPGLGNLQQVQAAELRVYSGKSASVGGVMIDLEQRTWEVVIGRGQATHRGDFVLRNGNWVVGDKYEYMCDYQGPMRGEDKH